MDHVVNLLLKELDPAEDLIAMPVYKDGPTKGHPMGLADPRFKGMNTKQVFDILKKQKEEEADRGDDLKRRVRLCGCCHKLRVAPEQQV